MRPATARWARLSSKEAKTSRLERLKRDASVSLAGGDYEKAVAALRDTVILEPAAATFLALGYALMAAGHHDEAVVNLQKSLQLEPAPDAHRYLAESFRALGRLDESRSETEIYRQSLQQLKRQRLAQIIGPSS
jgi:tetratricopeptide (TPR) repeat protein